MARCGCSSTCVCSISPSECITVSGNGSTGAPFVLAPIIDPDPTNAMGCGPDGLFAVPLAYEQTTCIDLAGAGTIADPLLVTPVIDPDLDNILECGIAGLFVDGTDVEVSGVGNTNCIHLSGNGTIANPLLATPVVPFSTGNILTCNGTGLIAGGPAFKTWLTAVSVAANFGAAQAATVTYLATLP
jgi:hypothetical protein